MFVMELWNGDQSNLEQDHDQSVQRCLDLNMCFELLSSKWFVKYEWINPYAFHLQFNNIPPPAAWTCCFYFICAPKKKCKLK